LPKETTAAESPNWASNLEPCDYQADALAVCYCLSIIYAFDFDVVFYTHQWTG